MRTCKCGNPITPPNRYRCKECKKNRRRKERQARKDAGLCATCGEPTTTSPYANCDDCRAKIRKATQERRKDLIKAGLCPQCGIHPLTGKAYCQECNDKRNAQYMVRYAKRKEQGLCVDCRNPADSDSIFCSSCRAIRRLENKRQREKGNKHAAKNRDEHRCRICGKTIPLCIHHIDGQGERDPLTGKRQKANDDLDNLITLCKGCHAAITRFINHNPQLASRLILAPQQLT